MTVLKCDDLHCLHSNHLFAALYEAVNRFIFQICGGESIQKSFIMKPFCPRAQFSDSILAVSDIFGSGVSIYHHVNGKNNGRFC